MNVDIAAAEAFMATHARLLDRRRFQLLFGAGDADAVLAAVDGYRIPTVDTAGVSSPTFAPPRANPAVRCTHSRPSRTSPP